MFNNDSEDNNSRAPLSWAAGNGHEAVAKACQLGVGEACRIAPSYGLAGRPTAATQHLRAFDVFRSSTIASVQGITSGIASGLQDQHATCRIAMQKRMRFVISILVLTPHLGPTD